MNTVSLQTEKNKDNAHTHTHSVTGDMTQTETL